MNIELTDGWKVLQDVHDNGECLGLYQPDFDTTRVGPQMSEWEDLKALKHLQLIYASSPYYGRELRYFNQAPWWYKKEFIISGNMGRHCTIHFTNVDYYCKVWLNGILLGEHEGYSIPFDLEADGLLKKNGPNTLIVKVWSPWDSEVDGDRQIDRTSQIVRNMVKGTYEHSDTFVQRDVNPVGIYGSICVEIFDHAMFKGRPEINYTLNENLTNAKLFVRADVAYTGSEEYMLHLLCIDKQTNEIVCETKTPVTEDGTTAIEGLAQSIRLWSTWDRGYPWLYTVSVRLVKGNKTCAQFTRNIGFRTIEMQRDENQTSFILNHSKIYIRGTSYFPDVYVSAMSPERYKRDLLSIKACGFNLVRVHVHVELEKFYDLCAELGIAVIQDSEYNWMHPIDDTFANRFISIFLQTVDMLKYCPAIFCWICMNEPGLADPAGRLGSRAMTVNPGPALYDAVKRHDPSRPAIKGSFCDQDPLSGDSHNYTGSLNGDDVHYSEIYGTCEKFNTEYGFDAPPCLDSLEKDSTIAERLKLLTPYINEIQKYQYALLKYYTEHYRMQKYAPNAGYVQFMFSDLCPQSFYGLFDWRGLPKTGLDAILESNSPVGVFLKYKDQLDAIYAVNDLPDAIGECTATWILTDEIHHILVKEAKNITLQADSIVCVAKLNLDFSGVKQVNATLILERDGKVLACNHYADLLHMPEHIKGHPSRMSHEIGARLYWA